MVILAAKLQPKSRVVGILAAKVEAIADTDELIHRPGFTRAVSVPFKVLYIENKEFHAICCAVSC
jgi:hypothetical protein